MNTPSDKSELHRLLGLIDAGENALAANLVRAMLAAPSAKNAPLMEIAHIVMGWQNEDEHTHVRMLYEIEELIARSDGRADG